MVKGNYFQLHFSLGDAVWTLRPFHLVVIYQGVVSATKSPIHQPLSYAAMKCKTHFECTRAQWSSKSITEAKFIAQMGG